MWENCGETHKCNKGNLLIIRRLPLLFRDPDRIRTCDPQLRRLLLYPAELPDQSHHILGISMADVERGCKGNTFFLKCNTLLK